MTIQHKVSAALLIILITLAGISYVALSTNVAPAFAELESRAVDADVNRAAKALEQAADRLSLATSDWAPWDETHRFVQGHNPEYINANLDLQTFENLNVDLALFLNLDGELVWGMYDGAVATSDTLPDEIGLAATVVGIMLSHDIPRSEAKGLVDSAGGLIALSSRPITRNEFRGPIAGTLVYGQRVDRDLVEYMRRTTGVDLDVMVLDAAEVKAHGHAAGFGSGNASHRRVEGPASSVEYVRLDDIAGDPLAIMQVTKPNEVAALGDQAMRAAMGALLVTTIAAAAAIWLLLQHIVVRPLSGLSKHIARIEQSGDLSERIDADGSDEISELAGAFDNLAGRLQSAQQALLEQSYKSGMAETAAAVLHNIRNAMTPLVNRVASTTAALDGVRDPHLPRAIRELADPSIEPSRRSKLEEYVALTFESTGEICQAMREDLDIAAKQANQVEQILSDQERISHAEPVIEPVDIEKAVAEAAHVVPQNAQPDTVSVRIDDSVRNRQVRGHRIGLVQIFSNILLNAYESIVRSGRSDGVIEVTAGGCPEGDELFRVTVGDNGAGIPEDMHQKIFERGFTQKTDGRGGLGLHWCANTLAQMGGRIVAESRGPGLGAKFHMDIPRR